LPAINNLEQREHKAVIDALERATKNCKNAYTKSRVFAVLAEVNPETLKSHLPAFARMVRLLDAQLPPKP
jgi:hypothetical protein